MRAAGLGVPAMACASSPVNVAIPQRRGLYVAKNATPSSRSTEAFIWAPRFCTPCPLRALEREGTGAEEQRTSERDRTASYRGAPCKKLQLRHRAFERQLYSVYRRAMSRTAVRFPANSS